MDTQVNKTDVFCLVNKNYDAVFNLLKSQLGNEQSLVFAERKQGAGYFLWRHPDNDWVRLSECDPVEKEMLLAELDAVKAGVRSRISENALLEPLADKIFVVPDESFIWYKNDLDGLRFLLTAWGYKYPLASSGGPIVEGTEEETKQDVKVGFTYQEALQPQMEFTIGPKASATNRRYTTDDSGMAYVGKLHPGVSYAILFLPLDKAFTLQVREGQEDYVFDVTRTAILTVTANRDGEPVSGAVCTIEYAGRLFELPFPENGRVMQKLVLQDDYRKAGVSVEGEHKELTLEEGDNRLSFEFQTPAIVPSAPEYGTPSVKVVAADGTPKVGYKMTATVDGTINSFATDEEGKFRLPALAAGTSFVLTDDQNKDHEQNYTVDDVNGEYVFIVPDEAPAGIKKWDCVLKLKNWTGFPIRKGAILYQQEGRRDVLAQIDTKGRTYLCYEDFRIDDTITAHFQVPGYDLDPVPFSLSKEHGKYIFRIRKINVWIVLLYILIGLLALCAIYWLFWEFYPW